MQPLAANLTLGGPLLIKGPLKDHLSAKVYPGFVVELNTFNITGFESHVSYLSFVGRTSLILCRIYAGRLVFKYLKYRV